MYCCLAHCKIKKESGHLKFMCYNKAHSSRSSDTEWVQWEQLSGNAMILHLSLLKDNSDLLDTIRREIKVSRSLEILSVR